MRILEKYVTRSYVGAFLFSVVLLMVLGVIGDILGFIDDIFKKGISLGSILSFYLYFAPFAFVNMVPFASLLSSVYVFNNLSKNHEITAVITSGISLWKLLRPIIFITLGICLLTFIVNDKLVPSSMLKANRIRQEKLESGGTGSRIRNLAIYGKGDQIIFAKEYRTGTKTLENVIIHRQDNDKNVIEKESVRLVTWDDNKWTGTDVIVFQVDSQGDFKGEPEIFKDKDIDIRETPKDLLNTQWDTKYMSYKQLKRYLNIFRVGSALTIRRLKVDLNYKLAFPFMSVAIILLGVPFSIVSGRGSALLGMAKGITVPMLYLPLMAISLALGKGGTLSPLLSAWLANIVFVAAGIYFINKKS